MTGKGFLHSTAALLTAIGTLLAALVALGVFLVGEGVLFKGGSGGDAGRPGGEVEFEKKLGREGTSGIELDGESGITRNPGNNGDIVFYESTELLGSYAGTIIEWKGEKQPTQKDCADLLETHGHTGTYPIEIGGRFCVRSSGGRTAFLAVISNGEEYQVSVWKKG
ncbi:MAG TPA: hypothetical protein VFC19_42235 [Candidatus Limnocylindrales bacterium]|nr:hypothetical protein [Candidatus Limnocylindrales bacterium]